ncbi:helix-turn-helix domain-containing protein [Peteryoungia desertarenae]|uniref:Helix-turn-helix domain-containing protein n=1 Tax=Peteryoungia desertarenae TaxID=1813451 RepID=A0ABX6QQP4_9HYPH|nr:helix-turn-helix domain-containing protein [Peteryoungia desertarenae]QLF70530.1 helix-turn-helix domain-containing protein [Peteryoungia desertarenae]
MSLDFGRHLKDWRARRRMSQLQLALAADVSARHVAFLETGRARPSRSMILRLGDALEIPRADRNLMLDAAGFRPAYTARSSDTQTMAPIRQAIAHMIRGHAPYPAFVFDRHWTVMDANVTGEAMLAQFGLTRGDSFIDYLLQPGRGASLVENWAEVARHLLLRLRLESAHLGGDVLLDEAANRIAADPALCTAIRPDGDMPPVVPVRVRLGEAVFPMFSAITHFGTAEDIALADTKIELFFPADEATERLFRDMMASQQS